MVFSAKYYQAVSTAAVPQNAGRPLRQLLPISIDPSSWGYTTENQVKRDILEVLEVLVDNNEAG